MYLKSNSPKANRRSIILFAICAIVSVSVSISSCSKNKENAGGGTDTDTPPAGTVSFSRTVLPIFTGKCASCHGTTNPNAGIQLTNHATINANASAAIAAINSDRMPPTGPLSATEKANIQAWIDQGKLNN